MRILLSMGVNVISEKVDWVFRFSKIKNGVSVERCADDKTTLENDVNPIESISNFLSSLFRSKFRHESNG